MKRKVVNKLLAASLATAMTVSMAGCGGEAAPAETPAQEDAATEEAPAPAEDTAEADTAEPAEEEAPAEEEEVSPYPVLTDADGNVYDLGGMEIIMRDWWSPADGAYIEPQDAFGEAELEWREWAQETYNFTFKQMGISDWANTPQDFTEYATTGDDKNYIFITREDPATSSAMASGLMYDLATLDCLDFSSEKFHNKMHEKFSKGDSIYAMSAGDPEPRTGIYFNKRILEEAGINPEDLYDWQANGEWTWDKFEECLKKVQQDTDNDGVIDIAGFNENNAVVQMAVYSNGADFIGKDADGKFRYALDDPATQEALEWAQHIIDEYRQTPPEDAQWDYYKQAFVNGEVAFMPEDAYCMYKKGDDESQNGFVTAMEDDFGFVMFPKGPQMDDYINLWSENLTVIPSCYDADRAWKIAFAWNLWTNPVPGYEDYNSIMPFVYAGARDTRAVDETFTMMLEKGKVTYHGVIPQLDFGEPFLWKFTKGAVPSEIVEGISDTWKSYVDAANQ